MVLILKKGQLKDVLISHATFDYYMAMVRVFKK